MLFYKSSFKGVYWSIPTWSWRELQYGLNNGIVSDDDLISYAEEMVDENTPRFDLVLTLILAKHEEVPHALENLVMTESSQDERDIVEKWIYAIVSHAYHHYPTQIYDIIERVYADFDYPESLSSLVRYMPYDGGGELATKLVRYLSQGKKKWGCRR